MILGAQLSGLKVEVELPLVVLPQQAVLIVRLLLVLDRVLSALRGLTRLNLLQLAHLSLGQLLRANQHHPWDFEVVLLEFQPQEFLAGRLVELDPEFQQYLVEGVVLLLHFLVVAAALFGLPALDEAGHGLEDFIGASQVLADEVLAVDLQEPVVQFVLLCAPVAPLRLSGLSLGVLQLDGRTLPVAIVLVLLAGQPHVALLAEEGLKVVARNHPLVGVGLALRREGSDDVEGRIGLLLDGDLGESRPSCLFGSLDRDNCQKRVTLHAMICLWTYKKRNQQILMPLASCPKMAGKTQPRSRTRRANEKRQDTLRVQQILIFGQSF